MQIILLERVERLGSIGDVVTVKNGFARNYLLPRKKALRATEANKKIFEAQRAEIEARNLEAKKEAEKVAEKLNGSAYVLIRSASDMGQLYGSVSSRDIASAMEEDGYQVHRNQIILDKPLKTLGITDLRVILHPEVDVKISVNIARSQDEAEAQARGENVLARDEEIAKMENSFSEDGDEDMAETAASDESETAEEGPDNKEEEAS